MIVGDLVVDMLQMINGYLVVDSAADDSWRSRDLVVHSSADDNL